jgi:hypothetical protein
MSDSAMTDAIAEIAKAKRPPAVQRLQPAIHSFQFQSKFYRWGSLPVFKLPQRLIIKVLVVLIRVSISTAPWTYMAIDE